MSAHQEDQASKHGIWGQYAYGWITPAFSLGSLALHWYFGWSAFVSETQTHGQVPPTGDYLDEMLRGIDDRYLPSGGHAQPHDYEGVQ